MTIAEALKKFSKIEIELLLGHVLQQSKEFLYLHPEQKLRVEETHKISELVKEREQGIPVAYLVGSKHFYGLNFKVNRNVLIPRPETEWMVDEALRLINKKLKTSGRKTLRVLDVGTGSGAIAVSIAYHADPTKVQVFAIDISDKALGIAKQNAKLAKVEINFTKSDLLKNVKGKFDVIVANPPYVPHSDYKRLQENLKFEPKLALTDGSDNFILIIKLLTQLTSHLNKNGVALIEIDPKAVNLSISPQFKKQVVRDIHGLYRFIKLSLK